MMPAPINNNTPAKTSISADNRAEKQAHAVVEDKLRKLDYGHKKPAENLISSYMKGDIRFNEYRSTFIRRLKYLLIRLKDPRSSNEVLHLTSQFLMLDQIRRSVGISLKEIRSAYIPSGNGTEVKQSTDIYKNPSILKPSGLPNALVELLKTPSSSGINYLEYIKNNVELVIFADFTGTKELENYYFAGLSDPISRTSFINTITYFYDEKMQAPYWALASQIIHETAHIEWDWKHPSKQVTQSDNDAEERYAYIMKYNYLKGLLSNAQTYKLEKHRRNIEATMKEIERTIYDYNQKLGYKYNDLSIK